MQARDNLATQNELSMVQVLYKGLVNNLSVINDDINSNFTKSTLKESVALSFKALLVSNP